MFRTGKRGRRDTAQKGRYKRFLQIVRRKRERTKSGGAADGKGQGKRKKKKNPKKMKKRVDNV